MHKTQIEVPTRGQGLYDITAEIAEVVRGSGVSEGLALVFVLHTTASLVIQENYDPKVQHDFLSFFQRLVPEGDPRYTHDDEGPDDMPSHLRTALTHTSEVIPVDAGRLVLGTWQALYLFEHRRAPHRRRVDVRVMAG